MIGIRTYYGIPADVAIVTNIVPASVGLVSPISANQSQKVRAWVRLSVGATGGVRAIISVPAGGVLLSVTTKLFNTVAPSLTTFTGNTVFTSALANAGTHWMEIEAIVVNGATAGNVSVQFAQNTSDVLTLTVLRGSSLEVVGI